VYQHRKSNRCKEKWHADKKVVKISSELLAEEVLIMKIS